MLTYHVSHELIDEMQSIQLCLALREYIRVSAEELVGIEDERSCKKQSIDAVGPVSHTVAHKGIRLREA